MTEYKIFEKDTTSGEALHIATMYNLTAAEDFCMLRDDIARESYPGYIYYIVTPHGGTYTADDIRGAWGIEHGAVLAEIRKEARA